MIEVYHLRRDVIPGGLVHHSDRGVQYACNDYIAQLEAAGVQPSMSRAGCPYDNAMAESFMKTLKHEEVGRQCLSRSRGGAIRHRRVHRNGLQSPTTPFGVELSLAGRV